MFDEPPWNSLVFTPLFVFCGVLAVMLTVALLIVSIRGQWCASAWLAFWAGLAWVNSGIWARFAGWHNEDR